MSNAELETKIKRAIDVLRINEPIGGYGLAFSGGKDSCVIKQLAIESGINFKSFYSVTTLDPPELVRFIQTHHKDVQWLRQKRAMLREMSDYKLFPPNPFCRWCCQIYKEGSLKEFSTEIIGVRASESIRRARLWKEVVEDYSSKKRKMLARLWAGPTRTFGRLSEAAVYHTARFMTRALSGWGASVVPWLGLKILGESLSVGQGLSTRGGWLLGVCGQIVKSAEQRRAQKNHIMDCAIKTAMSGLTITSHTRGV